MIATIFYFLCIFLVFRRGGQVWGRVSMGGSGLVGLSLKDKVYMYYSVAEDVSCLHFIAVMGPRGG